MGVNVVADLVLEAEAGDDAGEAEDEAAALEEDVGVEPGGVPVLAVASHHLADGQQNSPPDQVEHPVGTLQGGRRGPTLRRAPSCRFPARR